MSDHNPSSNLPLWTAQEIRWRPADGTPNIPALIEEAFHTKPSQLAGGNEQAASGLPAYALVALGCAMLNTKRLDTFSSDNVWKGLSPTMQEIVGKHPNALGHFFQSYAKQGKIRRTGQSVPSIRQNAKGRMVACWKWVDSPLNGV